MEEERLKTYIKSINEYEYIYVILDKLRIEKLLDFMVDHPNLNTITTDNKITEKFRKIKNIIINGSIPRYCNKASIWKAYKYIRSDIKFEITYLLNISIEICKNVFYIDKIIGYKKEILGDKNFICSLLNNNIFTNHFTEVKDDKICEKIYNKYISSGCHLFSLLPKRYHKDKSVNKIDVLKKLLSTFGAIESNRYVQVLINDTLNLVYQEYKEEALEYIRSDVSITNIKTSNMTKNMLSDIDLLEVLLTKTHDGLIPGLRYKLELNENDVKLLLNANPNNLFLLSVKSITKRMVQDFINNLSYIDAPTSKLKPLIKKFKLEEEFKKSSIHTIDEKSTTEEIMDCLKYVASLHLFEINKNTQLISNINRIIKLIKDENIFIELIADNPKLLYLLTIGTRLNNGVLGDMEKARENNYYIYSEEHAKICTKIIKEHDNFSINNFILNREEFICILSSYLGPEQLYIKTHGKITKEELHKYITYKKVKSAKK